MDTKWMRLPLAAAAIGALYLAASVGGAAEAGPTATASKLTKKQIKKVVNKQLKAKAKGLSVEHADSASSADQADNAENLAGSPASAYQRTVRWAVVRADQNGATVVRGNATGARRLFGGAYLVSFQPDIRGCAYVATNGSSADGVGPPGEISVEQEDKDNPTDVRVRYRTSAGAANDYGSGLEGFHVAVLC
jgi:hypothetical protein